MSRILKWSLAVTDEQVIQMPAGAKLLSVQMQRGVPQLWAMVDPDAPREARTIVVVGTGNPIHSKLGAFIGTVQMMDGALVWHVFEGLRYCLAGDEA